MWSWLSDAGGDDPPGSHDDIYLEPDPTYIDRAPRPVESDYFRELVRDEREVVGDVLPGRGPAETPGKA